ncbi:uncharacterized protein VP01_2217g6 [Puccinia sorghi]|uniref:DDE-1 domain-containing protein n=1 Tax=Puccinia sorghi TaxID=27349 RepID=A0A0L6VAN3_9BASI|nr:uncharacterized protein VP01_2217g6 [Puccinia sorghi]
MQHVSVFVMAQIQEEQGGFHLCTVNNAMEQDNNLEIHQLEAPFEKMQGKYKKCQGNLRRMAEWKRKSHQRNKWNNEKQEILKVKRRHQITKNRKNQTNTTKHFASVCPELNITQPILQMSPVIRCLLIGPGVSKCIKTEQLNGLHKPSIETCLSLVIGVTQIEWWVVCCLQETTPDELKEFFNIDETGQFYFMPPNTFLVLKKTHGVKGNKTCMTVSLICNANGSKKLPALFIGKYNQP